MSSRLVSLLMSTLFLLSCTFPDNRADAESVSCEGKTGRRVRIAIVDSGADIEHPSLRDHFARAEDGTVLGNDLVAEGPLTTDEYGHGTHIAGLIAASLDESCTAYDLLPIRILDRSGTGTRRQLSAAIRWASDHDAQVINLSVSYPTYDRDVDAAVQRAWNHGAILVAAGGNTRGNAIMFPAGYLHVLGVAASDDNGRIWTGSTAGDHISLMAPGVHRLSTFPTYPSTPDPRGRGFGYLTGTSQGAAIVSAAAARLLAEHPDWSNQDVFRYLQVTASREGTEWSPATGYGMVALASTPVQPSGFGGINLQALDRKGMPQPDAVIAIDGVVYKADSGAIIRVRNLPAGIHQVIVRHPGRLLRSVLPVKIEDTDLNVRTVPDVFPLIGLR